MRLWYRIQIVILLILLPVMTNAGTPFERLHLIGSGQAYYLKFIKVYDAVFYSDRHIRDQKLFGENVSKCLHLVYDVDVKREDFIRAANEVLRRQITGEALSVVKSRIDKLHSSYIDIRKGDSYSLCYDGNDAETTLFHNGSYVVSIDSAEFARVYFAIWLGGDKPLDEKLRDDLLAGLSALEQ